MWVGWEGPGRGEGGGGGGAGGGGWGVRFGLDGMVDIMDRKGAVKQQAARRGLGENSTTDGVCYRRIVQGGIGRHDWHRARGGTWEGVYSVMGTHRVAWLTISSRFCWGGGEEDGWGHTIGSDDR